MLPLAAGAELAVAATKTYTTQVAALALLAGHAAGEGAAVADGIRATRGLLGELLPVARAARVASVAVALAFVGRMFVIGRGPEFATAREISLKLLETCRVAAEPLTATDLAHGPIAALDGLFPVWVIASDDASLPAVREAAGAAARPGATLVASGTAADADRRRGLHAAGAGAAAAAARAAPLRGSRPAARLGARAGEGARPGPAAGLTKVTLAR